MTTTNSQPPAGPRAQRPRVLIHRENRRADAPAALGLLGVAIGTCTLSAVLAGWVPPGTLLMAAVVLFICGGVAPFLAAQWSYGRGDTFFGAAFGCIGAFTATVALDLWLTRAGLLTGSGAGLGVTGLVFASFALIAAQLMVAALWRSMALVGVLFFLALMYGLVGAGDIAAGASTLIRAGAWVGLLAAVSAVYTAGALVINRVSRRAILPGAPLLRTGTTPRLRVGVEDDPDAPTPALRLLMGMTVRDRRTHDVVVAGTSQSAEDVSRADVAVERAGRLQAEARAAAAEERAAAADWLVAVLRSELIGPERKRSRWWCPWSRRAALWRRRVDGETGE